MSPELRAAAERLADAISQRETQRVEAAPATPAGLREAARQWIFRHSSQPDGDRWRDNPDHLDWAADNLLCDLAPWLRESPTADQQGAAS